MIDYERELQAQGHSVIAGVDEAGRGALAGPVAAGAVILPIDDAARLAELGEVRDSKMLSARMREELYALIERAAVCAAVGMVSAQQIDAMGIAPATRLAMARAIRALEPPPDALLIDYVRLPAVNLPQTCLTKGEQHSLSIAAASIIAKVARDRLMVAEAERDYPAYGFAQHKGYGTVAHRRALDEHGPCAIHRRTFAPVRATLFDEGAQ